MPMPVIGVTPSLTDDGRITIHPDYLDALRRAGALPVLLPLFSGNAIWRDYADALDGLLLSGGGDIDPALYGEAPLPECGQPAPLRDEAEFALCRLALEKDMPMLAICRGIQVLNCVLGGTLYQDLETQFGAAIHHARHDVPRGFAHSVALTSGSMLERLSGAQTLRVNSRHHQAVKDLGRGLIPAARSEDGLIEAVEMPGKTFVLGVQWHPESLSASQPEAQRLFDALALACGGKACRKSR